MQSGRMMMPIFIVSISLANLCRAEDPMKEMMDMMASMMDLASEMTDNATAISDACLDGIANESQRIVYTAQLIDDMGLEIGYMADRIVYVEETMASLTNECLCNGSATAQQVSPNDTAVTPWEANPLETMHVLNDSSSVLLEPRVPSEQLNATSPWDPLFDSMQHALDLMADISDKTTGAMINEVDAIGKMSDNIVDMEDKIMIMSKQIGVMADRITHTIDMMSDAAKAFCPQIPILPAPHSVEREKNMPSKAHAQRSIGPSGPSKKVPLNLQYPPQNNRQKHTIARRIAFVLSYADDYACKLDPF
jgi:phage-related tail protein